MVSAPACTNDPVETDRHAADPGGRALVCAKAIARPSAAALRMKVCVEELQHVERGGAEAPAPAKVGMSQLPTTFPCGVVAEREVVAASTA